MLLQHLVETKLDKLTAIWQGPVASSIVRMLQRLEDGPGQMLGSIAEKSIEKFAATDPAKLFSLLPRFVEMKGHQEFGPYHAYADALQRLVAANAETALELGLAPQLIDKVPYNKLEPFVKPKVAVGLKLASDRSKRSKEEEQYDEENDLFVFIGRPAFVEVPEGSGNFKKSLEIENLVKVDRFDAEAHSMVSMMKLRARFQGENSEVYMVRLPAGLAKNGQPEPWLLDIIDKHKQRITN